MQNLQTFPYFFALLTSVLATNLGLYTTKNLCMDARLSPRWQMQNGLPAQAYTCANSDNQQITFRQDRLVAFGRDQTFCLDLTDGRWAPGTIFQYYQCSPGNPNQEWLYQPNGFIQSVAHPEFCVDVKDGVYQNGNVFQAWWCDPNNKNQIFSYGGKIGYSNGAGSGSAVASGNSDWVKRLFPKGRKACLAWGVSDAFYKNIVGGSKISAMYHWADGDVQGNNKLFMPMFWGDSKWDKWNKQLEAIGSSTPKVVLGFNEPDLQLSEGSAGMNPEWSAELYKKEIHDRFASKGSILVSPAVAWDYSGWLKRFMNKCNELGCRVDAIGYHIYLPINGNVDGAIAEMKKRLEAVYAMYKKPIMLTELGLTREGGGSDWQIKDFLKKAVDYLDNTDFIASYAFSGCFVRGNGWDGYLDSNSAFFNADGSLTDLGATYAWG